MHDHTSLPRLVRIGGMSRAQLLAALRARGVQTNSAADVLFEDARFTVQAEERVVEIAAVSVAELGFGAGATYVQLVEGAGASGLIECPLELGPHLRLQLAEQAESPAGPSMTYGRAPPDSLTVASAPLDDTYETPKGFYLRRVEGVSWLRGYRASVDHLWRPDDVLVFVRRSAGG